MLPTGYHCLSIQRMALFELSDWFEERLGSNVPNVLDPATTRLLNFRGLARRWRVRSSRRQRHRRQ